jgi:hypothetical protein
MREVPAQEGEAPPEPLGLARQRHPENSRTDYLSISRRANRILNLRVTPFLSNADGRVYRGRSND